MYCPNCGSLNTDDARFCAACGTPRTIQQPPPPVANTSQPSYPTPPVYGQPVPQSQPGYAADPRLRGGAPVGVAGGQRYSTGKSVGIAVFLSFLIPGVGQFYCGANKYGGIMLAIYLVSIALTGFGIGFVGIVGVWIWSMINAYNIASGKTPIS